MSYPPHWPPHSGPPALAPSLLTSAAVDPESPRPGTQSRLVVLAPLKLEQLALGPAAEWGRPAWGRAYWHGPGQSGSGGAAAERRPRLRRP